jgi:general secretion pathway protein N
MRCAVAAHVNLGGGAIAASGDFERDADAEITARNVSVHFPAGLAAPVLDIPALTLLGQIDGRIEQATLRGAWVSAATGSLRWNQAAVAGAAQAQLGDLEATFGSAADGSIAGQVKDLGGPLRVAGTFRVTAGAFDVDAALAARDGNPQVAEALRFIGEPQADGTSHLIIHGQLLQIF